MPRKSKILIAYDGSPFSDSALDQLAEVGLGENVEAKVLTLADLWIPTVDAFSTPLEGWYSSAYTAAQLHYHDVMVEAKRISDKAATKIRTQFPNWKVTSQTLNDSPAEGILKVAEKWKPTLILMGSQGHSALGRLLLGSVSHKVLSHAHCNVRIAKATTQRSKSSRILVAVDGSKDSGLAIQSILRRTWGPDVQFQVVVVVDYRLSLAQSYQLSNGGKKLLAGQKFQGNLAERVAEQAAYKLASHGLKVGQTILEGNPNQILLEEAQRFKATSIFMGSRGLNSIQRFFLGSVSLSLANHAPCSVEIVRH